MEKLPRGVRPARCQICPIARKLQYTLAFAAISLRPLTSILRTPRGTRHAPECLDSVHISARSRELLKAKKRRFYAFQAQIDLEILNFQHYNISIKMIRLCHSTQKHPTGAECLSPDLCSVIPLSRYRPER